MCRRFQHYNLICFKDVVCVLKNIWSWGFGESSCTPPLNRPKDFWKSRLVIFTHSRVLFYSSVGVFMHFGISKHKGGSLKDFTGVWGVFKSGAVWGIHSLRPNKCPIGKADLPEPRWTQPRPLQKKLKASQTPLKFFRLLYTSLVLSNA